MAQSRMEAFFPFIGPLIFNSPCVTPTSSQSKKYTIFFLSRPFQVLSLGLLPKDKYFSNYIQKATIQDHYIKNTHIDTHTHIYILYSFFKTIIYSHHKCAPCSKGSLSSYKQTYISRALYEKHKFSCKRQEI